MWTVPAWALWLCSGLTLILIVALVWAFFEGVRKCEEAAELMERVERERQD